VVLPVLDAVARRKKASTTELPDSSERRGESGEHAGEVKHDDGGSVLHGEEENDAREENEQARVSRGSTGGALIHQGWVQRRAVAQERGAMARAGAVQATAAHE
jgi:hypothetical protein